LILFYLVFQVNYMSLAGNWNEKGKKRTTLSWQTIAARLRSCALENVRQNQTNVRWANDRPGLRSCALEVN
jgi:hypothetical protein